MALPARPPRAPAAIRAFFAPASARQYSPALSLLLVAPLLGLLAFAFFYPVGRLIAGSLFNPHLTLTHYARLLDEPLYLRVLWRTVEVAFSVTVLSFLLGYPIAYAMAKLKGGWSAFIAACVLIPLWTSVLVRSYAWIVLLQRNGIINNALTDSGLVREPLRLLYPPAAGTLALTHRRRPL